MAFPDNRGARVAGIDDLQPLQIGAAEINKLKKFGVHTVRKLLQTPSKSLL